MEAHCYLGYTVISINCNWLWNFRAHDVAKTSGTGHIDRQLPRRAVLDSKKCSETHSASGVLIHRKGAVGLAH